MNEISIEKLPISNRERGRVDGARRRIEEDKSIITSHYVFVVDISSSMYYCHVINKSLTKSKSTRLG